MFNFEQILNKFYIFWIVILRTPEAFSNHVDSNLLDSQSGPPPPPVGLSLNQFREPSQEAANPVSKIAEIEPADDEKDDGDFQRGLDFDNMIFDQTQKVDGAQTLLASN